MPLDLRIEDLPAAQEPFVVTIDDYGFTGEGFVRLQDGWLSVRHAMPGEEVKVALETHQRGGRRRFATLLEVLTPHPERRPPLCDRADICRGCQLRHLSIQEEAAFKARALREVLLKFAGFDDATQLPPIHLIAPPGMMRADGWRVRTSLHYTQLATDRYELGLRSPGQPHLIPMADCPALGQAARRLVEQVCSHLDALARQGALPRSAPSDAPRGDAQEEQDTLEKIDSDTQHPHLLGLRIAAPAHGRGFIELRQSPHDHICPNIFALIEALDKTLPEHVSIFLSRGDTCERLRGPERLRITLAGLTLELDPRDWFHATLEPAESLYEQVAQWLDLRPGERFLDVGCGIGTLSLLAARAGLHATGIDAKLTSIQSATYNASRLGLGARAEFVAGSWESALKKLWQRQQRFDVATINPMREPLGERALSYLQTLGPERLVYLGPSPASTARDLGLLRARGWRVTALGGAMLHPATYHVMLVAQCVRDPAVT